MASFTRAGETSLMEKVGAEVETEEIFTAVKNCWRCVAGSRKVKNFYVKRLRSFMIESRYNLVFYP